MNHPNYADYHKAHEIIVENMDTERDIYYYNFLGQSGKFVRDRNLKPRLIPYNSDIRIEFVDQSYFNGFIITDQKGYRFFFDVQESITNVDAVCTVGTESPRLDPIYPRTAWFLSKIISPSNWTVDFQYENYSYTIERSLSQVKYFVEYNGTGCINSLTDRSCTRIETIAAVRLKKISNTETNSEVLFEYSAAPRLDLSYQNVAQGKSLEKVIVRHKNVTRKTWQLSYSYFMLQNSPTRLKLVAVKEDSKPAYTFSYNEEHSMPWRFAFSQDHWGFYNGKLNSSLVPAYPSIGVTTGADRDPDSVYMQSSVLNKITYPTGGSSIFAYGPHLNTVTEEQTTNVPESVIFNVNSGTNTFITETSFLLPLGANNITWSWTLNPIAYDDQMTAELLDGTTLIASVPTGEGTAVLSLGGSTGLTPGHTYKIRISRNNNTDPGSVTINWLKSVTATVTHEKIIFGGLRISSI
ncbi:hypothetical protein [Flavitalea sp.]|nr:hypothetical protein [Flavitalea sp.]